MKIKEGMYARFRDLTNYIENNDVNIDKIKFVSEVVSGLDETLEIIFEKYSESILKKDVIKASYDITDLLKVGDLLNTHCIVKIKDNTFYTDDGYFIHKDDVEELVEKITTKEEFENIGYRMGDYK